MAQVRKRTIPIKKIVAQKNKTKIVISQGMGGDKVKSFVKNSPKILSRYI